MSGVNVPDHFYTEYAQVIDTLLQQKQSRLSAAVHTGTHSGEKASPVDQVGAIEMTDVTQRFAPMPRTDSPLARRWVFPISSDLNQQVDTFDKLKLLLDPMSTYSQNATFAANRRKDKHVINNFFATASIGVNAGSTETFGTAVYTGGDGSTDRNISVDVGGAASALNVAKLKLGKQYMMENEVDLDNEPIYCGVTAKDHASLLNEIQVISSDFNEKPVLTEGRVTRFLGVNFIHSELFGATTGTDDQSGTSRQLPMWAKNGMHLGTWQSQVTDISQRKDLQGLPWQAYLMMTMGGTRLEAKRVLRIWAR